MNGELIWCPCNRFRCQNRSFQDESIVRYHLIKFRFVPNYQDWYLHGEEQSYNMDPMADNNTDSSQPEDEHQPALHSFTGMVMDAARPNFTQFDRNEQPNVRCCEPGFMVGMSKSLLVISSCSDA